MLKKNDTYTDQEVIDKVNAGEVALYEIIIRRYNPFLYRVGRAYGYNHEDTEDLMQETYVSAYQNLGKFEGRSSFKTWLIRIMLNQCYRKQQKPGRLAQTLPDGETAEYAQSASHHHHSTEKTVMNKELGHVIENALAKIPEEYRMVFTLRELNGLSVAETAEAFSISENNVKVRMNRAKKMLRTEIEKMYSTDDIYEFNLIYCDRMVDRVMAQIKK